MQPIPPEIFDPAFMRNPSDLQHFMLTMLKGGLDKRSRDAIGLLAAKFIDLRVGNYIYGSSQPRMDEKGEETVDALRRLGFSFIDPAFTEEELHIIDRHMAGKQIDFVEHGSISSSGKKCLIDDRPLTAEFGH